MKRESFPVFVFEARKGILNFAGTPFVGGRITYEFEHAKAVSDKLRWKNNGRSCAAEMNRIVVALLVGGNTIRFAVDNKSAASVFLKAISVSFSPADMPRAPESRDYLEYVHPADLAAVPGVKRVGLKDPFLPHNPESGFVYALKEIERSRAFIFSVLPPHRGDYVSFRAMHGSPHMEGRFGLQVSINVQAELKPGASFKSSTIQFREGTDPLSLLEELGEAWKRCLKYKSAARRFGWNSWDYYAGAVTSRDIYENQDAAARLSRKLKYFVIDEGYEPQWGVWEANNKFPEGLEKFCRRIRAKGGTPGIWTAPFLVNTYNPLYRNHPDWFARKPDGGVFIQSLSYGPVACLDVTRSDVRRHVFEIFRRLKRYGFEYFKVDFSQILLGCGRFADQTVPRGRIIRLGFETIRRAIGPRSYLLACGAPFESVTGIADAARTSGDIHNYWSHILPNARANFCRWWMNGSLWNNDPDFLIVRCRETTPDPRLNRNWGARPFVPNGWTSGREMTYTEAETYALSIYLSAGDTMLGDNLATLNAKGRGLLRKVLEAPSLSRPARPLDLFAGHDRMPSCLLAEEKDFWALGVFQWEENASSVSVRLGDIGVSGFQSVEQLFGEGRYELKDGTLALKMPPRSCRGFIIMKSTTGGTARKSRGEPGRSDRGEHSGSKP